MSIFKRGKKYWYKFMWHGELIRESTKQGNATLARNMEAAHRARLANGDVGIRERKDIPSLKKFCDERVEPWARFTFEAASPKTWLWYRFGIESLKKSRILGNAKLDEIDAELIAAYAFERLNDGLQISSV
jgi:hypothetical protein